MPCVWFVVFLTSVSLGFAAEPPRKRVLLIGQGPDNHKPSTHEYMAGVAIVYSLLHKVDGVQPVVVKADGKWEGGPDLLDSADGVFLFGTEGAKWISADRTRLAAFQRLAERGGGFAVWHWGMGTQKAEPIKAFVNLFGGCHGGPDRKHRVMPNVSVAVVDRQHPVTQKIAPFAVKEEFYYALKFVQAPERVTPLLTIEQDGATHAVSWAWQRQDGGRSFGFSGGHFHTTWRREDYRRLAAQGILWTLKMKAPDGFDPNMSEDQIRLRPRKDLR